MRCRIRTYVTIDSRVVPDERNGHEQVVMQETKWWSVLVGQQGRRAISKMFRETQLYTCLLIMCNEMRMSRMDDSLFNYCMQIVRYHSALSRIVAHVRIQFKNISFDNSITYLLFSIFLLDYTVELVNLKNTHVQNSSN